MLAKAQAAAAQAAQQAREAAERAAKQGTEALVEARNKASTLDTDTLMGNAVEGLERRVSGSFAKVSQLAEKSAASPMPPVGPASSTPKKRALDNLQREVSTGSTRLDSLSLSRAHAHAAMAGTRGARPPGAGHGQEAEGRAGDASQGCCSGAAPTSGRGRRGGGYCHAGAGPRGTPRWRWR